MRPVVAQRHKHATVNAIGCGIDFHSRKLNIYNFHFVALVTWQCKALSSATPVFGRK